MQGFVYDVIPKVVFQNKFQSTEKHVHLMQL